MWERHRRWSSSLTCCYCSLSVISHFNKLRSHVSKLWSVATPRWAVFSDNDVHGEGAGCPQGLSACINLFPPRWKSWLMFPNYRWIMDLKRHLFHREPKRNLNSGFCSRSKKTSSYQKNHTDARRSSGRPWTSPQRSRPSRGLCCTSFPVISLLSSN